MKHRDDQLDHPARWTEVSTISGSASTTISSRRVFGKFIPNEKLQGSEPIPRCCLLSARECTLAG
jgi:hypothetical protein